MRLIDQLEILDSVGLSLNVGVTIDDLLMSFDASEYEDSPFDLLLYMLGEKVESEPDGKTICSNALNLDMECIIGNGSYTEIAHALNGIVGAESIRVLKDEVDLEGGVAHLIFYANDQRRELEPVVQDEWADPRVIGQMLQDICAFDKRFFMKSNGQAITIYYLSPAQGEQLVALNGTVVMISAD